MCWQHRRIAVTDSRTDIDRATAFAAGAALFNEGHTLAARDRWEAAWLPRASGTNERLVRGLIAAAAATHHATERYWSLATERAESAIRHLGATEATATVTDTADHSDTTCGVATSSVRDWCRRLATDPEVIERTTPPALLVDGTPLTFANLELAATLCAAPALAGSIDASTEATVEEAVKLARAEYGTGRTTFAELLFAFCREPSSRPQVAARLTDHVDRERRKRRDVDGLF